MKNSNDFSQKYFIDVRHSYIIVVCEAKFSIYRAPDCLSVSAVYVPRTFNITGQLYEIHCFFLFIITLIVGKSFFAGLLVPCLIIDKKPISFEQFH